MDATSDDARSLPRSGWCPRGRRAEDGPRHPRYQLRETEGDGYRRRTRRNVADSDATLVLNEGPLTGGTALTVEFAVRLSKPHLVLQLDEAEDRRGSGSPPGCSCTVSAGWTWRSLERRIGRVSTAGPARRCGCCSRRP